MIYVQHRKLVLEARRQPVQNVQQSNRIGAAGYRNPDPRSRNQHVITSEAFRYQSDKIGGQHRHCMARRRARKQNRTMLINPPLTEPELYKLAANIKVLIMDVDGVLTDAKLYFFPDKDGNMVETKGFDAQDGIALQWANWYNIKTGVISGRNSPATVERARQVKMTWVFQGHIEKIPLIEQIIAESGVSKEEVAFIGDDLTDVVGFRRVGLSFAVANARPEVRRSAHAVTPSPGGSGAVRDVIEVLLKARGVWGELLRKYEVIS